MSYRHSTGEVYYILKKLTFLEERLPHCCILLATIYHFFNYFVIAEDNILKELFSIEGEGRNINLQEVVRLMEKQPPKNTKKVIKRIVTEFSK